MALVIAVVVEAGTGSVTVAAAAAIVGGCLWGAVVEDVCSERIPNDNLLAAVCAGGSAYLVAVVATRDLKSGTAASSGAAWGIALSGAAGLLLVWLIAPRLIGGGDVKMLAAEGAAVGVVDPRASFVVGAVSVGVHLVASAALRRRRMPFAPALFVGLVAGAISMTWFHSNLEVS